jgi:hypothetical protein
MVRAAAIVAVLAAGCASDGDRRAAATAAPTAEHRAQQRAAPPGPRLLLAGDGEMWVIDVRAGRARRLRVPLPGGDPPHRVVRRGDRFVLWDRGTSVTGPRIRRPEPLERRSAFFLPSTRPDRVWLFRFDRDSPATNLRFASMSEIDLSGRRTAHAKRPPRGWPVRAARAGILLLRHEPEILVWNPRTRERIATLPFGRIGDIGPVHGDTLASCTGRCGVLRLTDVRTGAQRRVLGPAGLAFEPAYAAFSSDGDLAVPVRTRGERTRRLALVESGRARVVPGSSVPEGYVIATWSRDDAHVFLSGGQGRERVIAWYRRDRGRARRIGVKTGAFYDMAAR